jgi:large subunit ribosomal protein L24
VMLVDPKSKRPSRVGIKREDGRRVRVTKRSGEELE